jgi:hypothetical protein
MDNLLCNMPNCPPLNGLSFKADSLQKGSTVFHFEFSILFLTLNAPRPSTDDKAYGVQNFLYHTAETAVIEWIGGFE